MLTANQCCRSSGGKRSTCADGRHMLNACHRCCDGRRIGEIDNFEVDNTGEIPVRKTVRNNSADIQPLSHQNYAAAAIDLQNIVKPCPRWRL